MMTDESFKIVILHHTFEQSVHFILNSGDAVRNKITIDV